MNILAIDTSTKKANVCIKKDEEIFNKSIDNEITHSEKLLPLIDQSLKEANLKLSDINFLSCSIGPGSFTGIRIGIATIKAFAKVLNVPVFSVSSLDILAYSNIDSSSDYVISMLDAKNNRVYYSMYKVNKLDNEVCVLEQIMDYANDVLDIALEKISNVVSNLAITTPSSLKIIGDCVDNYKNICNDHLNCHFNNISIHAETLSAAPLITMAENYIKSDCSSYYMKDYLTLDAVYVRPSQAERAKNNED